MVKDNGAMDGQTLAHGTQHFYSIFPIHQRPSERERGKKEKGHPQHVWRVIIFLMTVSSGDNQPNQPKRVREKERFWVQPKDLFRDMFYVKALDIPEKMGPETRKPSSAHNPKRTTNNTQQVYTIINYILFYGTN